jgi:putative membrane-bound dehydrogenase-like protein
MKSSHPLVIAALFCLSAGSVFAGTPPPRSEKARPIFDGRTLDGWEAPPPLLWAVKDGCLTGGDGKKIPYNDFLCTKASYANFILHLKIKLTGDPKTGFINSGIQIRTQRNPTGHEVCGYQCDYGEPAWYGAIYDEGRRNRLVAKSDMEALRPALKPGGWNEYVIKADGARIQTWINGVQGVDYEEKDADIASDGIIGIQVHGGGNAIVQVKDVFIEELPPTPNAATWEKLGGVEGQRAKLKPEAPAASAPQGTGGLRRADAVPDKPLDSGVKPVVAQGAAANADRAARQKESPVLKHLVPNPAKHTGVDNADAQRVISGMMLTPGFQAELIAAEPNMKQPIAFAIDERGRLWVAEGYSYPNRQPEGEGKDRISIFEDVDGDGTFEKRTTFIEGLNLVSGLEVGFGGVWVGAAPQLLFIPKDDHDKPGEPRVLLDGWGYQDTHETLNSFCWGPDGWLYGNQGVFVRSLIGKPAAPEAERTELRSGVWRYHPVRQEFEIFAHGGSNQWGLDFNSNGHIFMTHCRSFWGGGGTTHVIRNGHFWNQANANYGPYISNAGPDFAPSLKNYLPASARYDSGAGGAGKPGSDAIYGGHSHVGTMIYLGDNWPETYRDHLFTHNLFGHQMNHQVLDRDGSGYEAKHGGFDLLLAPDPQYMAVDLQTGPDGAVYLIDWCDLQHCHNPAPEKWDRTNGRIYRLSWAKTYRPVKVDLGAKSDLELAQLHTHRNDWFSRQARGLLQQRATSRAVDPKAVVLLKEQATGREAAQVLRALWTLHVIGALDGGQLAKMATHSSDIVRAWAVQLATEKAGQSLLGGDVLVGLAKNDPSPTVRLALASSLPMLAPPQVWDVATALAAHGEDQSDRFLPKMIWFGLAPVVTQDFPRALALADTTALPSLADSIRWFTARQPSGRDLLLAQLSTQPADAASRNLRLLAFALKDEAAVPAPATWPQVRARFAHSSDAALGSAAEQLAALFGDEEVLAKMRGVLADEGQPLQQRKSAFDLLKRVGDPEATPIFARLLDVDAFRTAVIPLLSRSAEPATADALIQRFEKFNPADRSAALNTLTSRAPLALALLEAVKAGRLDRAFLSSLQVRQMRNLRDAKVDAMLDQSWGKVNESSEAAKATIARLSQAYSAAPLWAYNANSGHETFNQICAVCHGLDGVGSKLGPDLAGSWRNGVDYFLENIVDPNAVVGENFQLHILTKKDGTVVSGLIEQETDSAITLRTLAEPVVVAKADVKDHQKLAQSLMPPGLLEALPERKVLELLKFLTSKPPSK